MQAQKRAPKRHFTIIALVLIILFVISFITNILNSIIVDVKTSFELSLGLVGLLPFAFFIAYGVMSIPAGFLSEKYGTKALLSSSFLIIVLASLGFSLFPGYLVFSITLFTLGCCMAVLQVILNPMLRIAGGEEHFAFNSVLAQLVFGSASFLSPLLYKYLVNDVDGTGASSFAELMRSMVPETMPWVSLYLLFAFIAFLLLVIVYLMPIPEFGVKDVEKIGDGLSYGGLLKNKWTLLYFISIFCYVGVEQGVGNWISQYLWQYHELDPQTIGANTVSYFWAMLTMGCILGLLLLKVLDSRKLLIATTTLTIVSLVLALVGSSQMAQLAFPMVGFFISIMWGIIFSLALNSVKDHHGSLSGILCTGIAGGAVISLIIGYLAEVFELRISMFFMIIPLSFILSIGFWAKPLVINKTMRLNNTIKE